MNKKCKKLFSFFIINALFINAFTFSQTITNSGANVVVESGTTIKFVNLNNIGNNSNFYYNTNLYVPGYWNNQSPAVFSQGPNGKVIFNGTSQQTIRSGGSAFDDAEVNNTSGNSAALLLHDDMKINGDFQLTNGILNTNNNVLIFGSSATSNSGNANAFVDGKMRKTGSTEFTFPCGDVNTRDFAEIPSPQEFKVWSPLRSSPSASTTVDVQYFFDNSGMPDWWEHGGNMDATLHHVSDREYWLVSSTENFTNVTLYWNNNSHSVGNLCVHGFDYADPNQFVPSDISVAYWNGSKWVDAGYNTTQSSISHDAGNITSEDAIPFGTKTQTYITYGSKNNQNPLPVTLINFYANCFDSKAELVWITASEVSNSGFAVEKSLDLKIWAQIGFVEGNGNSNSLLTYTFTDNNVYGKKYYYRLKQVDFDGKFTYSYIINLSCGDKLSNPEIIMYPNPTRGNITIAGGNMPGEDVEIFIYNMLGTEIYSSKINTISGNFTKEIDLSNVQPAMYMVKIVCNEFSVYKKLEKHQ